VATHAPAAVCSHDFLHPSPSGSDGIARRLMPQDDDGGDDGVVGPCGAASSLCFEAEGIVTGENYCFVGDGKGAYQKVPRYSYVGEGVGSWELQRVTTPYGWRPRACCVGAATLLLGLIGLAWLSNRRDLAWLWVERPSGRIADIVPFPDLPRQRYTCVLHQTTSSAESLEATWTATDRDRDARVSPSELRWAVHEGRLSADELAQLAVADTNSDGALTRVEFSAAMLKADVSHDKPTLGEVAAYRATWSAPKRSWCCLHQGIGCTTTTTATPTEPYSCTEGYANWEIAWSAARKSWCCSHYSRGCPRTTSLPYDCHAGYSNWEYGWSASKKSWCCRRYSRGCPTTTSLPYDCEAGYPNWQRGWSENKRVWCCHRYHRGCKPTTTSLPYDCNADFTGCRKCLAKSWSKTKLDWCCRHEGRGCQPAPTTTTGAPTTSLPYDCMADFTSCYHCLQSRWSVGKRVWCCQHKGRGCPPIPRPPAFDCDAGYSNWLKGWSARKKDWCCQRKGRGCPAAAVS